MKDQDAPLSIKMTFFFTSGFRTTTLRALIFKFLETHILKPYRQFVPVFPSRRSFFANLVRHFSVESAVASGESRCAEDSARYSTPKIGQLFATKAQRVCLAAVWVDQTYEKRPNDRFHGRRGNQNSS